MVIRYPLAFRSRPREAAVMPFPRPETTPPVTKIYFTAIAAPSCKQKRKASDGYFNTPSDAFVLCKYYTFVP